MTLADARFAGQLITTTGRILPFDDPGCLATFVGAGLPRGEVIGSLWVNDYLQPDSVLDARSAVFLRSDTIQSPMDYHLAALRPGPSADSVQHRLGGQLLSWDDVVRTLARPAAP